MTVVTIYTTRSNTKSSAFCPHSVFIMPFVSCLQQTAIIFLYSVNRLILITETQCVHCAVRTEYLKILLVFKGLAEVQAAFRQPLEM